MNSTPQLEDGYSPISNEILLQLCKKNLSSYQTRVLFFLFRKTYGYQKKEDWISNSQFVEATGIRPSHVSRAVSELLLMNIVTKRGNKIAFQKDSRLWKELPIGVKRHDVTNRGNTVTNRGNTVTNRGTHKRNYTKETIQKKYTLSSKKISEISDEDLQGIADKYDVPLSFVRSKHDDLQNWYDEKPEDKSRRNRNWLATLRNWVKRDALQIKKEHHDKSKIVFIE